MIDFSSGPSSSHPALAAVAAAAAGGIGGAAMYGMQGYGGATDYSQWNGVGGMTGMGGMTSTNVPVGGTAALGVPPNTGGPAGGVGQYSGPYDPNSSVAYGYSGFPGASPSAAAQAAVVTADLGSLLSSVSTALTGAKAEEKINGYHTNGISGAPGDYEDVIMDEDDDDVALYSGDLGKASRLAADIARRNNEYMSRHTHIMLTSMAPIGGAPTSFGINTIRDLIA
jgi:hypothetical protein